MEAGFELTTPRMDCFNWPAKEHIQLRGAFADQSLQGTTYRGGISS
jgi:hypothetical protein